MPRALTISRTRVPVEERDLALGRLRARQGHYRAEKCNHWVFEDARVPGDFTEFAEAPDAETLAAAHASAPDPAPGGNHLLREVVL
jgi:hypothetical protein